MKDPSVEAQSVEINLETPERLILAYLYDHPGELVGPSGLVKVLNPETQETPLFETNVVAHDPEALDEVQQEVESLIVNGLVKGKRILEAGSVHHTKLKLTNKGEIKAILHKRAPKRLDVDL